jgi:hypothetical protein
LTLPFDQAQNKLKEELCKKISTSFAVQPENGCMNS